jgi:hypoxanthine phosphoribosyltransferase
VSGGRPSHPFDVLLSAREVEAAVRRLAAAIAPDLDDEAVVVCLLTGGLWFAADLMRVLAELGRHPLFDALWLASYGDAHESAGEVEVRAGLQRPVEGRDVLILDDVLESGLSLTAAGRLARTAGARSVRTAVFARKPWPHGGRLEPDFVAWEAPARFLVGYGMDHMGRYRGLAGVAAAD